MKYSSCKNCEKRKLGCHSTCADYQKFVNEKNAVREERQRQKEVDEYFSVQKLRYFRDYVSYARR